MRLINIEPNEVFTRLGNNEEVFAINFIKVEVYALSECLVNEVVEVLKNKDNFVFAEIVNERNLS